MNENNEHNHDNQMMEPQPSSQSMILMLNQRLDQKATDVRRLENSEVEKAAVINDLMSENATLIAAMDQITTENRSLRERLGLDEIGAIDAESTTVEQA